MGDVFNTKKLGFGLMRLPKNGDEIDIEQTKQMVDMFMDAGFNYFDTAWAYTGSEEAARKALVERYPRESFTLASKLAAWIKCETREDALAQFDLSLERSGAGYFDYYLLHNLGEERTHFFEDFGLWDWAFEQKAAGKIKHVGFSFHSTPEELDEILTKHPEAEFVQLQINYIDWEDAAIQSRGVYEVATKHGKPVIVMEPVKGGLLANPPAQVKALFDAADPNASYASWAIRYAADLENVAVVLSGMSNIEQMENNLSFMKDFDGLTPSQRATLDKAREEIAKVPVIPCTGCDYCAKVCPMGIGISGIFKAMNLEIMYGDHEAAMKRLDMALKEKKNADECIHCGACEEACPQHIEIRTKLEESLELLK